jgi:hypothetical protein
MQKLANSMQDSKDKDFGLAFWAGRLSAEMLLETELMILSQKRRLGSRGGLIVQRGGFYAGSSIMFARAG